VRAIAIGNQLDQYLVDGNLEIKTAQSLKLNYIGFSQDAANNSQNYLVWIKQMVKAGHSVVMCA